MTFTPEQLQERTLHRRAIEAAIWGIPAVNYEMMSQALVRDAEGAPNQIVYWSRLLDGKNQTLTPNPDAIYLMPFYDTTYGPVVLEIPPADDGSITGSSTTPGSVRSPTSARRVRTQARAASTSSCRRTTRTPFLTDISP